MKPHQLLALAVLPWAAGGPALAQDPALERCRGVEAPAARLACYDAVLPPRVGAAPSAPGTRPSSATAPAPVEVAPRSQPGPSSVAASKAEAAASPAAPPPRDSQAEFGFESRRRPADAPTDRVVTSYQGVFGGWGPAEKIPLANGQVWQIADGSQTAYDIRNPAVRIVRGAFGSFFMEIEGVSHSPRVRRVQ